MDFGVGSWRDIRIERENELDGGLKFDSEISEVVSHLYGVDRADVDDLLFGAAFKIVRVNDSRGIMVAIIVTIGSPQSQPVEVHGDFLHDTLECVAGIYTVDASFDGDGDTRQR